MPLTQEEKRIALDAKWYGGCWGTKTYASDPAGVAVHRGAILEETISSPINDPGYPVNADPTNDVELTFTGGNHEIAWQALDDVADWVISDDAILDIHKKRPYSKVTKRELYLEQIGPRLFDHVRHDIA